MKGTTPRAQLAAGVDPISERKQEKYAVRAAADDDFEGIAWAMWAKKLTSGKIDVKFAGILDRYGFLHDRFRAGLFDEFGVCP